MLNQPALTICFIIWNCAFNLTIRANNLTNTNCKLTKKHMWSSHRCIYNIVTNDPHVRWMGPYSPFYMFQKLQRITISTLAGTTKTSNTRDFLKNLIYLHHISHINSQLYLHHIKIMMVSWSCQLIFISVHM